MSDGFFSQFDRFLTTSTTSPFLLRLNGRHEAIIAPNTQILQGKRILDIASHDGRWSFAALKAGAAHVTGIEPRQQLIDNARNTFEAYGVSENAYEFIRGDVFDILAQRTPRFDVVLCLGFYYHTIRHVELFDRLERSGASHIVIDTTIAPATGEGNAGAIHLCPDTVELDAHACLDSATRGGTTIVGHPTRTAVRYIASHFGFDTTEYDWKPFFVRNPDSVKDMADYAADVRATFYCKRRLA
jgi:hypothetical protein